jgi:hypothetical protein
MFQNNVILSFLYLLLFQCVIIVNSFPETKHTKDEIRHYRLGDILSHPDGGCCGNHSNVANQILNDFPKSLVSRYLFYSSVPNNFTALELALSDICPKDLVYPTILVHLRLGDVVCGKSWHEEMKRPYPVKMIANALKNYEELSVGLCYNIRQSSISSECNLKSSRYVSDLKKALPYAKQYAPDSFADIHFCAMMNVPLFVAGKGFFSLTVLKGREFRGLPSINLGTHYFSSISLK